MKNARAADYRRELRKSGPHWPTRIENIAYEGLPGLGTGEVNLSSPVTIISGGNGAGKSTLLQAVWSALAPEQAEGSPFVARRLNGGSISVTLQQSGTQSTATTTFTSSGLSGGASHGLEVTHIETSNIMNFIYSVLSDSTNPDGITNGIGGYELSEAELNQIGYITRRDYRSVTLYEIDAYEEVIPFFEVSYGEDRYDSRTMGSGEHAAFLIWWLLRRAQKNSIVLMEEPETFLSSASQEALGAHITSIAVEKKLCVILATHSGPIISPLGAESTQFMFRTPNGIEFDADAPPSLLRQLGVDPPVRAVVFVEDYVGETFCRHILEKYDVKLARAVDISVRNGEGGIIRSLSEIEDTRRIKFVGLFDGDVRDGVPENIKARSAFLPGTVPAERAFRDACAKSHDGLTAQTGNNTTSKILTSLEGSEIHDWYHNLAAELGLSRTQLFPMMFRVWLDDAANEAAARETAQTLSRLIDGAE